MHESMCFSTQACFRHRNRIAALAACVTLAAVTTASGQYTQGFNALSASAEGVDLNGQDGYYNPAPDTSVSAKVYTYADNTLGIPANPTGGANFAASVGPGGDMNSRSQRDVSYGDGAWNIAFDFAVGFLGDLPTMNNIGSFSTQPTDGSESWFIFTQAWTNFDDVSTFGAAMTWFDEAGNQVAEFLPTDFQTLDSMQWYRCTITVGFDSNRIHTVSIGNLDTLEVFTHFPIGRYMAGGAAGGTTPTAFRLFGGAAAQFGNMVAWDNLRVSPTTDAGACCFNVDGSCAASQTLEDCEAAGGTFQGEASVCQGVVCDVLGPNGWVVEAPFSWFGDTCESSDDCTISSSNDIQWEVTIPEEALWRLSVCEAQFDSTLSLGTTPCSNDIAFVDDTPGCVVGSEIEIELAPGTYYLTLEGLNAVECGLFTLDVTPIACVALDIPPDAIPEAEVCGEDANGGCNSDPATFNSVNCGDLIDGTTWWDGGTRDTDWYELIVTKPTDITLTAQAESVLPVFGVLNSGGSGDCADVTGISPFAFINQCGDTVTIQTTLAPGTWWFFFGVSFDAPLVTCGTANHYLLEFDCGCPWDLDGDNAVAFQDLLQLLSNWGPCAGACPEDLTEDGNVGFADLLQVLSNWGPCP